MKGASAFLRPRLLLAAAYAAGLAAGGAAALLGHDAVALWLWRVTTAAAALPLAVEIAIDLVRRAAGVDLVALLAMVGCLLVGQELAGAVIAVMLGSGRALEDFAQGRARRELTALLERSPRLAHRVGPEEMTTITVEEVAAGDTLLVKPGEVLPTDGFVIGEPAILDESALTGEARPVARPDGELVRSGTVNAGRVFTMRASAAAADSTYAGIVRLVREAERSRAPMVRLADRYALAFIPLTIVIAAVAGFIARDPVRAVAVLVVATPCPLILAAPVAIVAGISRAARRGVVVKDGGALESLGRARVLLFDKTGTLTAGHPELTDLEAPERTDPEEVLRLAASLDQMSVHPLATALVRAARLRQLTLATPAAPHEELGKGIRGVVEGRDVAVGRLTWVAAEAPDWARRLRRRTALEGRAAVFVAIDDAVEGAIVLDDPIRPDSARTLRAMRSAGISRIVMVSGDHAEVAETVGGVLGVDGVLAERSPDEKVSAVTSERHHGVTIMVGDGINDAPALAAADIGVAMGARGATASSEAADVVLVVDRLDRLAEGLRIARRSRRIALESILAGTGLSLAAMIIAAAGFLVPVAGAVLQEAIDVAVILNALRALGGGAAPAIPPAVSELSRRLQREHDELRAGVDSVRRLADTVDALPPLVALTRLREVHEFLEERLLPHEFDEERAFYPLVAERIGGEDPTATMARAHVEIAHLSRLLGRSIEDAGDRGPGREDMTELRRLLYGLHAILRLHFAQEEEAYLSLVDDGAPHHAVAAAHR